MCRNTLCENFGVRYGGQHSGGNARYRLDLTAGRVKCLHCLLSFQILPNQAVRPLARHFLSLSLPFADCPAPECANHGANLFENCPPKGAPGPRRYRWNAERQAVCCACQRRFTVGEAMHVAQGRASRRRLGAIMECARMGVSVTKATEIKGIGVSAYYAGLLRAGCRVRDHHSWRNAGLLRPGFAKAKSPLQVRTDVLEVSLQRFGDGHRHQLMKLLVSVAVLPDIRSFFVLAAHPFFLPENRCPGLGEIMEDMARPTWARQWDGIAHLGQGNLGATPDGSMDALPDLSRKGCFMRSPHAELAHFLVVGKMLSRFRQVHFHMDGDRSLYASALVAFADRIRRGSVEIALFQHDKKMGRSGPAPGGRAPMDAERRERLDQAWDAMNARLAEKISPKGQLPMGAGAQDATARARAFRSAFKGAYSATGEWAWLEHPPPNKQYARPRTLWLTWKPGQSLEDGLALLLDASLQSVDSAFNAMREHVRSLGRPEYRSQPGRGYRSRYVDVDVALCELWLYLLMRNYAIRSKTKQLGIPARALGLAAPKAREPDLATVAWSFRLGREHAERMSAWTRAGA